MHIIIVHSLGHELFMFNLDDEIRIWAILMIKYSDQIVPMHKFLFFYVATSLYVAICTQYMYISYTVNVVIPVYTHADKLYHIA